MTEAEEDKCIFCEKITVGVRLSPDTFVCHECYGKLGKVEKKIKRKKAVKKELCVDKVLKFLKENPKFFKVKKIAESVGHSPFTVKESLTKLRKEGKIGLYKNKWWGLKENKE
jgi:hypothetical protein